MDPHRKILIISGPTASGKSDLALNIAKKIPAEIINADIGQFYKPFSVGTAKPNWENSPVPHHLFDIIDEPKNFTVSEYRELLLKTINTILEKKRLPIIVGGSLFYLKSLFFPPLELEKTLEAIELDENLSLWDQLNQIDSKRASQIHPSDTYRLERALHIWKTTGEKPSEYNPQFDMPYHTFFVFLNPPKETLVTRINRRSEQMLAEGWIEEVQTIINTPWESFLKIKKLIGYPDIIRYLKKEISRDQLIESIQKDTWAYARRQTIFWKSFQKQLKQESQKSQYKCKVLTATNDPIKNIEAIIAGIDDIDDQ